MRRTIASIMVVGIAFMGVSACGSEQAAENTVNDALGGSASVDMGEDGEIRVDTGDGSIEIGTGEFPEGWPADLTVIPGFTLAAASVTSDGLSAQMVAEGDETEAVRTYAIDLQANQGWAVDPSLPPGANGMWALTKEGKVVTMFSAAAGDQTVVIFSIADR
ncbi:MAG: hypothetical protein WEA35_01885 [Candidatus Nanopelagicales bacterium]